jgi:Tol biopolymer transport system component
LAENQLGEKIMNENQTPLPDDLEKELNEYYSSPEPRPEFVARLERGLHSKLKEQEHQKMFGRSAKLKWGFGLAFAALVVGLLVTSPTVVTAMKKLFGYIPGVGVVETSSPLRVLAEPVSQTRDGITVTVDEAVASADKTVIVFTIENIPIDKLSHQEDQPGCGMSIEIRLPDGRLLQLAGGQGEGWGTGYKNTFTYAAIPTDVNEATLLIPCVQGALPGVLPENWELYLRFVPAPDNFTALPVIEYTPSPQPNEVKKNPITISQVIDTGDAYILLGDFSPPWSSGANSMPPMNELTVLDGNGQPVMWEYPQDVNITPPTNGELLALKIAKGFTPPLGIQYSSRASYPAKDPLEFEFDAGENPQPGDVWQLNKEFNVDGHALTLTNIEAIIGPSCNPISGYGFTFISSDTAVSNVSVTGIDGYALAPADSGNCIGGGGGGGGGLGRTWEMSLGFTEMPKGKLKVKLAVDLYGEPQEWKLEWQPQDPSTNSAAPMDVPDACLTADSWQAATSSPALIPADLTGKLIAYGRILEDGQDPSPDNFGVFAINLDGSNKQVIGPGVWPSLSPDGTQAVYAWDDGLYIANLASGEKHLIPNTNANDYGARWSPDGKQIAFIRIDDFNLYTIQPDGSALRRVINGIEYEQLVDWTPDGKGLFYAADTQAGMSLKKLDIASGATSDLFAVEFKGAFFDISPDGKKIAFPERMGMSTVIYTSNLDGSDRRLIAQMGNWTTADPIWSPDGNWLIIRVLPYGIDANFLALVNMQDCRVIPLSWNAEQLSTWIP